MHVFVCADLVVPDDPNCDEAIEGRVFDGNHEKDSIIANLSADWVLWRGSDLVFQSPVRVVEDDIFGPCVAIGPLVFPDTTVETLRTAIAIYDAL